MNNLGGIKNIMGKLNPQKIVMNMMSNNNPMIKNLVDMANKGDTKGVENFARNLCKEKGVDFDKEISNFMNNFK